MRPPSAHHDQLLPVSRQASDSTSMVRAHAIIDGSASCHLQTAPGPVLPDRPGSAPVGREVAPPANVASLEDGRGAGGGIGRAMLGIQTHCSRLAQVWPT